MTDPVPVIPLEYADLDPASRSQTWLRVARVAAGLALPDCVVALLVLRFVKVESVLITGAVLFLLGTLTLLGGAMGRRPWFTVLGGAHCFVCVLFFVLVNVRGWSPDDAREPFTWMGLTYTLAAAGMTWAAFASRRGESG